nr:(S)-coclaurine N-methyltransferase-like [Tanacetum cinerariifolium]
TTISHPSSSCLGLLWEVNRQKFEEFVFKNRPSIYPIIQSEDSVGMYSMWKRGHVRLALSVKYATLLKQSENEVVEEIELQKGILRYDYGQFYVSKLFFGSTKIKRVLSTCIPETDPQEDDIEKRRGRLCVLTVAHINVRKLGLKNVAIIVANVSTFEMEGSYDQILSIEMFEHMENYKEFLKKM